MKAHGKDYRYAQSTTKKPAKTKAASKRARGYDTYDADEVTHEEPRVETYDTANFAAAIDQAVISASLIGSTSEDYPKSHRVNLLGGGPAQATRTGQHLPHPGPLIRGQGEHDVPAKYQMS